MKTVKDGLINDPATWDENRIPLYGDTLEVYHKLELIPAKLEFNELKIMTTGELYSSSTQIKYHIIKNPSFLKWKKRKKLRIKR